MIHSRSNSAVRTRSEVVTGFRLLAAAGAAALWCSSASADSDPRTRAIEAACARVVDQVVAWRRDIHQHPELSNRETRTARLVATELRRLGLEVRTGIARTGVVGVLRGAKPGGVVALRADMDALPVAEETGLPFASTVKSSYRGEEVSVMHACGHDVHVAILLGAARALAELKSELQGSVLFVFQPAEEGPPPGEKGGAALMLEEGALRDPAPSAIFALHAVSDHEVGTLAYRYGGAMASSDRLHIRVKGRQTHAAMPWLGVDPIHAAAQLVLALEALPTRAVDARIPAVVSIGAIHGGVRNNIIPAEVELLGTMRSLDPEQRTRLRAAIERTTAGIAAASGTEIALDFDDGNPVTMNDPALTRRAAAALEGVISPERGERVIEALPMTGAEDFAFFAQAVPGFFFWLGTRPKGVPQEEAAPNHSPKFSPDEAALPLGVRAMVGLALAELAATSAN